MEKDEFFPTGWSHRRWFSGNGKSGIQNKKPRQDAILDMINENQNQNQSRTDNGLLTGAVSKIVITGSGASQPGLDQKQDM